MSKRSISVITLFLFGSMTFFPSFVLAAHPLITDDAGTQGRGKYQVEVNGAYLSDREVESGVETVERTADAAVIVSAGITDRVDVVVGLPYQRIAAHEADPAVPAYSRESEKGFADATLEAKWRFIECFGMSLAFKPGIIIPTGDEEKGLGAGKHGFITLMIATQEAEPWAFHFNAGYIRNNNKTGDREDLYHVSLATEYRIKNPVRIVANMGLDRNPDGDAERDPIFALPGSFTALSRI